MFTLTQTRKSAMFYVFSKILGVFVVPSNFLLGLGLCGLVLSSTRFARAGRRLLVGSVALIAIVGVLPLWVALDLPLEDRFPLDSKKDAPTGMIVLGGVIDPMISAARGQVALGEAAERITATAELARRYPAARIVVTGGSSDLIVPSPIEADYASHLLEDLGVSGDRIVVERRARNTAENAIFTKQLIAAKPGERWLLITSAMHMPRAIGVFRKIGFAVVPYPVDYQTAGLQDLWILPGSPMDSIRKTDAAVHEWVGLLVYWITGRTNSLFPAPT
jgi:uncharacterized SAM-binding protein YcdF (DUF218 family)